MATGARRTTGGARKRGAYRGLWGTVGRPRLYSTEEMGEAILEAGGNLTKAAAHLRCDPETLRRRALKSPELGRVLSLTRARSAEASFKRRERERRQREREEAARRAARQEEHTSRPSPRVTVEVTYLNEEPQLVRREGPPLEADVVGTIATPATPPARGRRLKDLPWAAPSWPAVRLLAPVEEKHFGWLEPGDVVRVPASMARSWARDGIAEVVGVRE